MEASLYNFLFDCDFAIRIVFENMDSKKRIFMGMDRVMSIGSIFAINTSALNIDEIATVTERLQDMIGLHFFSPANVLKFLEVVRAGKTTDDVVATSMQRTMTINKIATLVGVCPRFAGNPILFSHQFQSSKLVDEDVMHWDVDAALNVLGFKMGSFKMSDLAGFDQRIST